MASDDYDPCRPRPLSPCRNFRFGRRRSATARRRVRTSVQYRFNIGEFRFAALYQFGGYARVTVRTAQYSTASRRDFGGFLVRRRGQQGQGCGVAVEYSGNPPSGLTSTRTSSRRRCRTRAASHHARYTWGRVQILRRLTYMPVLNPTDDYPKGSQTIAECIYRSSGAVTSTAYDDNKICDSVWTGVRYSYASNLDLRARLLSLLPK